MKMKGYVYLENGKPVTTSRNHKPPYFICMCPKDSKGEYITDIEILDVDESAKTAVLNKSKRSARDNAMAAAEISESIKRQDYMARQKRIEMVNSHFSYLIKIQEDEIRAASAADDWNNETILARIRESLFG